MSNIVDLERKQLEVAKAEHQLKVREDLLLIQQKQHQLQVKEDEFRIKEQTSTMKIQLDELTKIKSQKTWEITLREEKEAWAKEKEEWATQLADEKKKLANEQNAFQQQKIKFDAKIDAIALCSFSSTSQEAKNLFQIANEDEFNRKYGTKISLLVQFAHLTPQEARQVLNQAQSSFDIRHPIINYLVQTDKVRAKNLMLMDFEEFAKKYKHWWVFGTAANFEQAWARDYLTFYRAFGPLVFSMIQHNKLNATQILDLFNDPHRSDVGDETRWKNSKFFNQYNTYRTHVKDLLQTTLKTAFASCESFLLSVKPSTNYYHSPATKEVVAASVEFRFPQLDIQVHWPVCFFATLQQCLIPPSARETTHNRINHPSYAAQDASQLSILAPLHGGRLQQLNTTSPFPTLSNNNRLFCSVPHLSEGEWIQFHGPGNLLTDQYGQAAKLYVGSLLQFPPKSTFASFCTYHNKQMTSSHQINILWL